MKICITRTKKKMVKFLFGGIDRYFYSVRSEKKNRESIQVPHGSQGELASVSNCFRPRGGDSAVVGMSTRGLRVQRSRKRVFITMSFGF